MKFAILSVLLLAANANADMPSTHGMLIFGDKATYASHLPMFHSPHDYQVVMKISMADFTRVPAMQAFENAKAAGESMFTIQPEVMDLTKVMSGEIKSFKASLYKGHFERGGELLGGVKVTVEKFIVKTKLNPAAPEQNQFLEFGEADDQKYSVHIINGKPSFDQVKKVPGGEVIYFEEQELAH